MVFFDQYDRELTERLLTIADANLLWLQDKKSVELAKKFHHQIPQITRAV